MKEGSTDNKIPHLAMTSGQEEQVQRQPQTGAQEIRQQNEQVVPQTQKTSEMQQNYQVVNGGKVQTDTEHTRRLKENFGTVGFGALLYACFYAFCMYKNASGITFPFFIAGSLFFLCYCLSKLEISLKKGSGFYMTGIVLLAVSTFCTDNDYIINMNKTGIFLLMVSLLLNQIYNTSGWKLGKYLSSILISAFACLGELWRPFSDGKAYYQKHIKEKNKKIVFAAIGFFAAIPLVLIVFALLVSADAVFRSMTSKLLKAVQLGNVAGILFMVVFMFLASYCLLAYLCRKTLKEEVPDRRHGEPILAITVTTLLTIIYLMFSVIQIVYLFLGNMQLPDGYTYAEYAREGFFQLLAVSILNLAIVLTVMSFFRENKVLKGILIVMCFCTFIMIASSAMRMMIYIQYYYLTFLRIFVLWALAVLFLLFAGVIICIFKDSFPLFRYSAVVVTVCYLVLSFGHPDYWIARVNVGNYSGSFFQVGGYEDYSYLTRLSADAAPVMIPYLEQQGFAIEYFHTHFIETPSGQEGLDNDYRDLSYGYRYLSHLYERTQKDSWRSFNLSRYLAKEIVESYIR